tara:strand:+ start:1849 stop:2397 length:549 start_codon:yes stop_codon:yes gene_type:complete
MTVELDFEVLRQTNMSADDFVYLYVIYRKGYNYLDNLNLKPNLDKLQEQGYVKLSDTPDQHVIRQEFIDLFFSNFDQMFAELISTYPMKVMVNGNIRVLHAIDPDSKSNLKAKNRYAKIVGKKLYKHKHIISCLNNQLKVERENLGYMQNLEVWLNNYTWEKYENIDKNDTGEDTTRITRSL